MREYEIDHNTFIGGWYMPEDACDQVLNFFNDKKSFHKPGVTGAEKTENVEAKKCTQLDIIPDAKELNLYNVHLKLILDTYKQRYKYVDHVNYYAVIENMSVQHYKPGEGYYKWHMENIGYGHTMYRHLVFMTYLNDIENAGTEFYYFPDLKIQARKGLTLIWPAGWTHTHRGVVSDVDEKYIITGWLSFHDK